MIFQITSGAPETVESVYTFWTPSIRNTSYMSGQFVLFKAFCVHFIQSI